MAREMEEPTDALDLVVQQVVQPRLEYLGAIVSAITGLPPRDARVMRSVASLQAQCLMFAKATPPAMAREWAPVSNDADGAAEHIAEFSLAGMRAVARQGRPGEPEAPQAVASHPAGRY